MVEAVGNAEQVGLASLLCRLLSFFKVIYPCTCLFAMQAPLHMLLPLQSTSCTVTEALVSMEYRQASPSGLEHCAASHS